MPTEDEICAVETTVRERLRVHLGRQPTPRAAMLDSQSVKPTDYGATGPRADAICAWMSLGCPGSSSYSFSRSRMAAICAACSRLWP